MEGPLKREQGGNNLLKTEISTRHFVIALLSGAQVIAQCEQSKYIPSENRCRLNGKINSCCSQNHRYSMQSHE